MAVKFFPDTTLLLKVERFEEFLNWCKLMEWCKIIQAAITQKKIFSIFKQAYQLNQ